MSINSIILLLLIIIASIFTLNYLFNKIHAIEGMVDIPPVNREVKWKRNKNCKFLMTKTIKNVLNNNNLVETKGDDWVIYMPCTYNHISDEISQTKPLSVDQRFFIVNNADQLTSKSAIWRNLVKTYGRDTAKKIMPTTYILNSPKDISLLKQEHHKDKIYIMKKNIQRQKGLEITRDVNKILKGSGDSYVVAQELLQDPYLIDGRKINMRFYVLFVCRHNEVSAYVHREGFMYYTKERFKKNTTTDGPNITTGYIDRKVYDENPLTLGDFKQYLDNSNRDLTNPERALLENGEIISNVVFGRIYYMLKLMVDAVSSTVCVNSKLKNFLTFQLFGADVALNDQLFPQLIEINKGPDLGAKDGKDGDVKHKVVTDIFKVIKVLDGEHDFLKIVDT